MNNSFTKILQFKEKKEIINILHYKYEESHHLQADHQQNTTLFKTNSNKDELSSHEYKKLSPNFRINANINPYIMYNGILPLNSSIFIENVIGHFNVNLAKSIKNISCGINLQISSPTTKYFISSNSYANTLALFLSTRYGILNLGFQNGIEKTMNVNSEIHDAGNPVIPIESLELTDFYISPVLYSESIANLSNKYISLNNKNGNLLNGNLLISTTPRISFQTPNIKGFKFGISYSYSGYNKDLFTEDSPTTMKNIQIQLNDIQKKLSKKSQVMSDNLNDLQSYSLKLQNEEKNKTFYGPNYKNIISGGISYDDHFTENIKASFSLTGEYAKTVKPNELTIKYNQYTEVHNLSALSIGFNVDFSNVDFSNFNFLKASIGGSYGYLGKSGLIKHIHYLNNNQNYDNTTIASPDNETLDTTYFTLGSRYKHKNSTSTITFMHSKYQNNSFNNLTFGEEYLFTQLGKADYTFYLNYSYIFINHKKLNSGMETFKNIVLGLSIDF